MTKAIKFVALGIEHRHIFGMAQNLMDAGAEFVGWWTEGEPDVVEGFVKRFPTYRVRPPRKRFCLTTTSISS